MRPIQTINIEETLRQFASDSYTLLSECDFKLHGVYTYVKSDKMEAFGKYTGRLKEEYSRVEAIIEHHVIFRQVYKITLQKQQECDLFLDYEIEPGTYGTHPLMTVKTSSVFPFQRYKPQELFTLLVREINKIKARQGMMIGLFSDAMVEDLKKLVKQIYTRSFDQEVSILLFSGIEPELAMPSQLIMHFMQKNVDRQLKEVEVGELIVEYIKPIYGSNGLNAYGKQVTRGAAENEAFLKCEIDDATIETVEDERRILLYSKKRGFVHYRPERIEISNKVTMPTIKRVQSQVAKEEQNEVEVVITQNDITEDSVGEGVHLTSETIHISGHIADKAKLEAKQLIVDGATHQGAKLFANRAVINRHKGTLRCHYAEIRLLEGGEVHGSHVHVDAALGGTIYADHVTLGTVKHHLKVYATSSITVNALNGEDNRFVIDYRKIPIITSRLEYIEEDIDELRYYLEEAKRHREQDIPKINKRITELKGEIEEIRSCSFHATVTIKNRIPGLNIITFALPKNRELTYRTREGFQYDPFHLEIKDETVTLKPVGLTASL
jgi:hypothetical protein